MAIAFVSGSASGSSNPTSGNFPLGAFSNGNVAIFFWWGRVNTKLFTDNSGGKFTTIYLNTAISGRGALTILRRVLVTGDVATDFAWTSNDITNADVIQGTVVFSGVDTTTPLDAESGTPVEFVNTQSPDPPSVLTVTDQAAVITIFGKNNDYAASVAAPTSYTIGASAESTAGTDASAGLAYRLGLSIATEDPGAWTLGGATSDDGIVWTGALRPTAGAPSATNPGWVTSRGGWW